MGEYVHSQQVQFNQSRISCGVLEAHHLPADTTGNQMVFAIANHLYHKANGRPAAFVTFSDITGMQNISRGELLADAIEALSIGGLFQSERQVNPKTGNTIIVWLWTLDHDAFRAWYTDEYANRVEA
jgi:hypothetical protein